MLLTTLCPSISAAAALLFATTAFAADQSLAQVVVFLQCTFFNGRVDRIKLDPNVKQADFRNGGTFALEVSESFYTLTAKVDLGAGSGGVVELETKIDRRSQQLTSRIVGGKNGYFTQYPLGGICTGDQPWSGTVF